MAGILAPDMGQVTAPILAETSCRFRVPVMYPAELLVSARTTRIYEYGLFHSYELKIAESGVIAATGEARIVVYDYSSAKISKVTPEMITAVSRLEGRSFTIEAR